MAPPLLRRERKVISFRSRNLHQEVVAPDGDLAFAIDAVFRWMLLQQIDRKPAKPRKVVGHSSFRHTALVFVEGYLEQRILDHRMATHRLSETIIT
jgi:hypothetical protein